MSDRINPEELHLLENDTLTAIATEAIRLLGERATELSGVPSSSELDVAATRTRKLINPLSKANRKHLPPSIFGDERVRIVHDEDDVIYVDDQPKPLRPVVFKVASVIAANRGMVVGHGFMLKTVWPYFDPESYRHSGVNPNTKISSAIHGINRVLGNKDLGHSTTGVIRTVRGVGHKGLIDRDDL